MQNTGQDMLFFLFWVEKECVKTFLCAYEGDTVPYSILVIVDKIKCNLTYYC